VRLAAVHQLLLVEPQILEQPVRDVGVRQLVLDDGVAETIVFVDGRIRAAPK
jgi:hypothetical protein